MNALRLHAFAPTPSRCDELLNSTCLVERGQISDEDHQRQEQSTECGGLRPVHAPSVMSVSGAGRRIKSESDMIDFDFSSLHHHDYDDARLHHPSPHDRRHCSLHHDSGVHNHIRRLFSRADSAPRKAPLHGGARQRLCAISILNHPRRSISPPNLPQPTRQFIVVPRLSDKPRTEALRKYSTCQNRAGRSLCKRNLRIPSDAGMTVVPTVGPAAPFKSPTTTTTTTTTATTFTTAATMSTTMITATDTVSPSLPFATLQPPFKRRADFDLQGKCPCPFRRVKFPKCDPRSPFDCFATHRRAEEHSRKSTLTVREPIHKDSGYESSVDKQTSEPATCGPTAAESTSWTDVRQHTEEPTSITYANHLASTTPHNSSPSSRMCAGTALPGVLDPQSVTCDQLVKGARAIYANLVGLESKCMTLDTHQTANSNASIDSTEWAASHTLHQKLLHEHHDFFMVTQHPNAPPALRALPSRYGMAARMWKYGIHGHLEVLRSRRPQSQDCMLLFIHLAYQMIALLYETVSSFADTWTECLGDLARYRMAVEEDRETHAQWCTVASRWYSIVSDRHPSVGRLNHHLGILERSSVKKLYYYTKALTCAVPFHSAKDSLTTVCTPLMRDLDLLEINKASPESCFVTFHAAVFLRNCKFQTIAPVAVAALCAWCKLSLNKLNTVGVSLALTNISIMLYSCEGLQGPLWSMFNLSSNSSSSPATLTLQDNRYDYPGQAVDDAITSSPPPTTSSFVSGPSADRLSAFSLIAQKFCYKCVNTILQRPDVRAAREVLPFLHIMLAWFYCLSLLLAEETANHSTVELFLNASSISWQSLASQLNDLTASNAIPTWLVHAAHTRNLKALCHDSTSSVLCEDYLLRGYAWSQAYLSDPTWFENGLELEGRNIEQSGARFTRIRRIQWLSIALASKSKFLRFDEEIRRFSAVVSPQALDVMVEMTTDADTIATRRASQQFKALALIDDMTAE